MKRRESTEVLERLRRFCLSFPESRETMTWGHPNFRAGAKIFSAFHEDRHGSPCIWIRVDPMTLDLLREDPRISRGSHGGGYWVGVRADLPVDWGMVESLLREGYRIMALKRMVKALDAREEAVTTRAAAGEDRPASPARRRTRPAARRDRRGAARRSARRPGGRRR